MALIKELPSLGGLKGYLRLRNIVLFRDSPGAISNYREEHQPKERLQVDFEVYISEEARREGKSPIGGVHTFVVPADDIISEFLAERVYQLAKQDPYLADAEDA